MAGISCLWIDRCHGNLEAVSGRPFRPGPLDPVELDEVLALVRAAGAHGTYVASDLTTGCEDGEAVVLHGADALLGVLWFGRRGNLILVHDESLAGDAVARAVEDAGWPWRIALGPGASVDGLARRHRARPLVHRNQLYYASPPAGAADPGASADRRGSAPALRAAQREDLAGLLEAALALNHDDLGVDRDRVDLRWLERNILQRIGDAATWVLGEPGHVRCKLDYGSWGPDGLVLEGVYTFPGFRGRGLAAGLVRACLEQVQGVYPSVCLHVAESNAAARRCYEKAGMVRAGACRLLLL